jgi:hypothetical protein
VAATASAARIVSPRRLSMCGQKGGARPCE